MRGLDFYNFITSILIYILIGWVVITFFPALVFLVLVFFVVFVIVMLVVNLVRSGLSMINNKIKEEEVDEYGAKIRKAKVIEIKEVKKE